MLRFNTLLGSKPRYELCALPKLRTKRPAAFTQGIRKVGLHCAENGRKAGQDSGRQSGKKGEGEDSPVERKVKTNGKVARQMNGSEQTTGRESEESADNAAKKRQHNTFGHEMACDPQWCSAKRCANGDLFLAQSRSNQNQIGDVHAGDQQHEPREHEE